MSTRILVIEDNPANMELMVYLLEAYGHTALVSSDGEDGVAVAISELPDLIICDINLPKLDGYGVVARIRKHSTLRWTPVIAVTALAMVGDREKLLDAGFDAYIGKPIEPETFVRQVEELIAEEKRSRGTDASAAAARDAALDEVIAFDSHSSLASRHARILVVDDSAVNSELIHSTLTPFGYVLTLADSVQRGLALARTSKFDLIVSDLHMPHEDGFAFLRAVKADPALAKIPFMFLSASFNNPEERRLGLELGATLFVARPIEPQTLLAQIDLCLAG